MPRLVVVLTSVVALALAQPVLAQTGRVMGQVIDQTGKGIKGATVRATNPDSAQTQITSTTDEKGRFGMIGLRAGVWQFTIEAPGFEPSSGSSPVRSATLGAPLRVVLARSPEVIPGALTRDIVDEVSAAEALRAQGRFDQALAAYQAIQTKNPKVTSLHAVIGDTLRQQAERETNPAAKQGLYARAATAYAEAAKDAASSERTRLDFGLAQVLAGQVDEGVRTLQALVAALPMSAAAKDAAAKLAELRR
jgi:tetratricopeptide (TPR) repeat protein